jgi:cysteine desulfurase
MNRTYLDHNATSPLRPEARAAMLAAFDLPTNASSVHAEGRAARQVLQRARAQVARLVGAEPGWIIFTSGATEANNWVLGQHQGPRLVSAIEHPSVLEMPGVDIVPVLPSGMIDLAALEAHLTGTEHALVSLMLVNNETGIIQPVAEAARLAHKYGALIHSDAVQAAGRIPLSVKQLGVDYLTVSSHKIGGPQGVGALVVACGAPVQPLLRGGRQENRQRAGTENVAGIAGFGAAAEAAWQHLNDYQHLAVWRDSLETQLPAIAPELIIFGRDQPRVANTSLFALPGLSAETQLMALDLAGIAVSSGAACSSGKVEPSSVLTAMGIAPDLAKSAIRVSLGWNSTEEDVARFAVSWQELYHRHLSNRAA